MADSKRKASRSGRRAGRPADDAASGWRGAWDRLSARTQHLVCILGLLVLSLGFFAPIHFSGQRLAPVDTVNWRAMAEAMQEYEAEADELALWAPNAFAGMPGYLIHYPKEVPQLDSIPRLLRFVIWPTSHFFFLLLGTYLLVVLLTRSKLAGVLSAAAYGLTTYIPIILIAGHNTKFLALCFAPWMVLAFAYVLRKPSLLAALLFAIAAAVNLRAEHIQITYYTSFLIGIWWIVEGVQALRRGEAAAFGKATAWLALGSVLALLMVAQPYLPTYEYKEHSIRGATSGGGEGGLDWDYAMNWSQGLGEIVTLAIADAYGGDGGTYWGPKPFTAGPHYVGGIVLLLALLALWRLRRRAAVALGIGALLMILFSFGQFFPALNRLMYDYFPLFDAFRVPETWLSLVAFALAVLGGLGLYVAGREEPDADAERQKTRAIYITAGSVFAVVLVLFLGRNAFFDFQKPDEAQRIAVLIAQQNPGYTANDPAVVRQAEQYVAQQIEERADLFTDDAFRTLFFLFLAGVVLLLYRRETLPAWAMQVLLILLVTADLWGVARRYLNEDSLVSIDQIEERIPQTGFDQYILQQQAALGGPGTFRVLSYEFNRNPFSNARPAYYYETLNGYHAAKLRLFQDYIDYILIDPETRAPNENALDLMNVRYLVAPGPLPELPAAFRDQQTDQAVLENLDVLPRAFFVGETEVIEDAEATWRRIQDSSFDPARTALLPVPLDVPLTPIDSASTATAEVVRFSPRELVIDVDTDAPRLLVVSEVYYPEGWTAAIDGEPVPIARVNYLLRGVPVPAGQHTITMRFDPASHTAGVWIAGVTTLLVYLGALGLLGLAWRRRTSSGAVPGEAAPAA